MAVEQGQLVDQQRSKSESGCVDESSGWNLTVHLEDGLEMLVEVLVGDALRNLWKMRLTSTPSSLCG
jgi:hypothetical protein